MNTRPMASPAASSAPLKVDVLRLLFLLFGAPHIFGERKSDSNQNRRTALPGYAYLVPLAAAIAGGLELLLLQG